MRTLHFLFPVFLFVFIACSDAPEQKTGESTGTSGTSSNEPVAGSPEAFGKEIASFIIANDNQGVIGLIIEQTEMEEVIKNSSVTTMGKEVAIKNIPMEISKMRVDYTNGLTEIRKSGETAGIVWENCKFKEAYYEISNPTGYNMMQLHCVLDCNGQEHEFTVTDVVETENGWKLGGTMMFGKQ